MNAEQIDKELTSRQRAKLTKRNTIKISVAVLFYLLVIVLVILFEV